MATLKQKIARPVRRVLGVNQLVAKALTMPTGQVTIPESRFLGGLVRSLTSPGPIIEIGTLFGYSTRMMILNKQPDRRLITVDKYAWNPIGLPPELHHQVTRNILKDAIRDENVEVIQADKADFYATYSGPAPALAFLDAIHNYEHTAADIRWARAAGAGMICVHDYGAEFVGVTQAVDEAGGYRDRVGSLVVLA